MVWFVSGFSKVKQLIHRPKFWHEFPTDPTAPTGDDIVPQYQSSWKLTAAEMLTVCAYMAQLGGAIYLLIAKDYESSLEKDLLIGHLSGDAVLLIMKAYLAVVMHKEHNYFVTEKKHHGLVDASMALNFILTILGVTHSALVDSTFSKVVSGSSALAASADYLTANYLQHHPHKDNPARVPKVQNEGTERQPALSPA